MPDPVTNVEIEDVLSSIRRLVAEGSRAGDNGEDQAGDRAHLSDLRKTQGRPKRDKLVLTPALRVATSDDQPAAPAAPEGRPEPDTAESDTEIRKAVAAVLMPPAMKWPEARSPRASLEATIAELEAAVTPKSGDWEPDGSEVTTTPSWEQAFRPIRKPSAASSRHAAPQADAPDPVEPEPETTALTAEPLTAVPENTVPENTAPESHAPEFVSRDAVEPAHPAPAIEREPAVADIVSLLPSEPARGDAERAELVSDDTLDEIADALPAVETGTVEPAQDDDAHGDDAARVAFRHLGHRRAAADHLDDLIGGAAQAAAEDEVLQAALARGPGLTEAELRPLVLSIVREELQGKLGERITRNVRKLVRREIMRVLNAQDMD